METLQEEKRVTLNGKEVTMSELEEKKKEIEGQKGVRLVESVKDTFRIKIEG